MIALQVLVGTLGPVAMMITLLILGELSRRLGQVTKAKPIYRSFYVSAGLCAVSVVVRLLHVGAQGDAFSIEQRQQLAFLYIAPLSAGLLISIVTAWRYWGWLIYASEFQNMGPRV